MNSHKNTQKHQSSYFFFKGRKRDNFKMEEIVPDNEFNLEGDTEQASLKINFNKKGKSDEDQC